MGFLEKSFALYNTQYLFFPCTFLCLVKKKKTNLTLKPLEGRNEGTWYRTLGAGGGGGNAGSPGQQQACVPRSMWQVPACCLTSVWDHITGHLFCRYKNGGQRSALIYPMLPKVEMGLEPLVSADGHRGLCGSQSSRVPLKWGLWCLK